jgi:tetratricopeptide (TPR) repeat protein
MGVTRLSKLKSATEADPDNLDNWFALGKYATDRFIVGIGEEALTKVAKDKPDNAEVLGLLAKALNRRRKLVEAEKVYSKALTYEPNDPELITGLAVVYGNQGELEKAVPLYERALAIDAGHSWAVHAYVHVLKQLGRKGEVLPLLDRALKKNPDSALINILYGLEEQERGNQSSSKTHMEKGLERIPIADCEEQSRALRMIMPVDPDSVITYGKRILEDDPDNMDIELFVNMAGSRTDPQGAAVAIRGMLDRDPNNPRIIGLIIPILLQAGDMAGAMEFKKRLETTAPEDGLTSVANMVLARAQPGGLLVSQQTRESYVESARDILKRFPVSPHANLSYIRALISNNQFEDARKQAIRVMNDIEMDDIGQHLGFALILRNLGLHEESKAQYLAASKITDSPYENLLIQLVQHTENEDYSELANACSEFIEHNQATPELYAILGRVQHYTNNSEAKTNLEIAAEAGNHDARILLSNLLSNEGDEQRAVELLEQVMMSKDLDSVTRVRCLMGFKQFSEASDMLEKHLEEHPSDYLGWYLLALMGKREGEPAVKNIMRKMLESGAREVKKDDSEGIYQRFEIDKGVDELTKEVMIGELGGRVKHLLLSNQVMTLLNAELKGEKP